MLATGGQKTRHDGLAAAAALLGAVVLLVLTAPSARAGEARISAQRPLGDRGIELTVATTAFAGPVKVQVYLPVGYAEQPARRWPVTYYLGGTNHDETTFASYGGERLTRGYGSIIVAPRGDSGYWSDWYNGGAGGAPQYETFVIDQLIPLIDATYRTAPGGAHRAIFGESMGGYGVMMLAARHPDLFTAASSLSGAGDSNLHPNQEVLTASPLLQGGSPDAIYGPRGTQEVRWRGHNPVDLVGNLRDVDLQVLTADGTLDPALGEQPGDLPGCALEIAVANGSRSFHRALTAAQVPHRFVEYPAGCHSVPNFAREIADSLPAFTAAFARPRKVPARFSFRAIEPRFAVWGWDVAADPARALEFLELRDAGRSGLTVTGSGATRVTTPPFFPRLTKVDVVTGGATTVVRPDAAGRLAVPVDLGPPHAVQQYTRGAPTASATAAVVLRPHARASFTTLRAGRVCVRAIGGSIPRATITVRRAGRRSTAATVRLSRATTVARCRPLPRLAPGRYAATLRGRDGFGHVVAATRALRLSR
ncbi:hypothetical protein DSM112329_01952 [Paraconexibacter sp. AEG42_29]|uniref:Esterase n=1 Tax=Paraconexibacter sp. AEG42_29 TaxID=2997339 RepID=A0AAU7ATX0_9ACTN